MNELRIYLGVIGSGKDYSANLLENYTRVSFADPLRTIAWKLLGYEPKDHLDYENFKISKLNNFQFDITGRKFLQNLGETMRNIDSEFWTARWEDYVKKVNANVVCTDCRYPNEIYSALALSNFGYNVKFIWCCYTSEKYINNLNDAHTSEKLAQFLNTKNLTHDQIISHSNLIQFLNEYEKEI